MTGVSQVVRDERTTIVEDASYRIAYGFITFALLLDVMYRSLVSKQAPWDLLAIVITAGAISTLYQWRHQIVSGHSLRLALIASGAAAVMAALIAWFLK
jgi:hypothetical protein